MKTEKRYVRRLFLFTAILVMLMSSVVMAKTVDMKYDSAHKMYIGSCKADADGNLFFRVKLSQYGLVDVTGLYQSTYGGQYGVSATLVNAKGTVLDYYSSNYLNSNNGTYVRYAVAPGTYCIKVPARKGYAYAVAASYFLKSGHNGGSKKSKAVTLKRNKAKTGVISASSFKAQSKYFKFYVPEQSKPVKLKLIVNGGQGQMRFYISGPNLKKTRKEKIYPSLNYQRSTELTMYQTVTRGGRSYKTGPKAGWYYVMVRKASSGAYKRSSGQFAVKWSY